MRAVGASRKRRHRAVGRPRSEESHQAILKATLELLARDGFPAMSIEGVAERAGVGKTTIYRRWASKEALVLAALQTVEVRKSFQVTGDLHTDILAWARNLLSIVESVDLNYLDLFARILGEARANPSLLTVLIQKIYGPRLDFFREVFETAKRRGDIRDDVDFTIFLGVLGGAFIYNILLSGIAPGLRAPKDADVQMVDIVLHGIEPRGKERTNRT